MNGVSRGNSALRRGFSGLGISQKCIQNSFWNGRKISFGVKCFVAALGVALIVASVVCPPFAAISALFLAAKIGVGSATILKITLGVGIAMAASTLLPLPDLVRKLYFRVKYNVPFTGSKDTKTNALDTALEHLYTDQKERSANKEKVLRNWRNANSIPTVLINFWAL